MRFLFRDWPACLVAEDLFEEADEGPSLKLEEMERQAVERALRESRGNRRLAARALGMSERTLYRRIRKFGLSETDEADPST